MRTEATTPDAYLAELEPDRAATMRTVLEVVRRAVPSGPDGYAEAMNWGMVTWEVPLERYPDTYNDQPLGYVALASQKRHCSLYLMGVYATAGGEEAFRAAWSPDVRPLDMGKACVRFRRAEDLDLPLIERTIADVSVDQYIAHYETARGIA